MKVCLVTKFSWNLSWFVLIYIQDFNLILMEVLYMADFSAISALSSLSEKDLYYQWMINNNSTSTMLNALSGNSSDSSNMNGMSGIVNAISSGYSSLGMASLLGSQLGTQGLASLFGSSLGMSDGGISSLGTISSFSSILKMYLNSETSQAADMAGKLSEALEKADEAGESSTNSYKTVQEIYNYFVDKSSVAAQALSSSKTVQAKKSMAGINAAAQAPSAVEFNFDSYINGIEEGINKSISASTAHAGISM